MTNFIKKIVLSAALGLVLVTPVLAQDATPAKCELATKAEAQAQIEKVPGLQHRMLTNTEVARLIDSKGSPPNAVEGTPVEAELIYNDMIAGVNIYQNGCFINKLGPAMKALIFQALGLTEVSI